MATLQEVLANETTAKELFAQETPEAALAYLQGKGVEISGEDLKAELEKTFGESEKVKSCELSESDLEKVAGGMDRFSQLWWEWLMDGVKKHRYGGNR